MKKLLIAVLVTLCLSGCSVEESTVYSANAHCEIITEDGNIWEYDGAIMFDNNGTPDNIYDDIIVGIGR